MNHKWRRARPLSFWNLVFLFTIGTSLILMATMLFAPGHALAQQALPVSIQSPLLANYNADEVIFQLPPVQLRLAEEAAQDRLARFEHPIGEHTAPVAQSLKTPVPSVTAQTQPPLEPNASPAPTKTVAASLATRPPTKPVVVARKPTQTRSLAPTQTSEPSKTPVPPAETSAPVIAPPTSTFTRSPVVASPTRTRTPKPTTVIVFPTRTRTPTRTLINLPTKTVTKTILSTKTFTKTILLTKTPTKTSILAPTKTRTPTMTKNLKSGGFTSGLSIP